MSDVIEVPVIPLSSNDQKSSNTVPVNNNQLLSISSEVKQTFNLVSGLNSSTIEPRLEETKEPNKTHKNSLTNVEESKPLKSAESKPKTKSNDIFDAEEDDAASVLVIILQCETKSCDQNITNLKWVFSDPYFTVQVCAVDPPPNIPTTKTLTQAQYQENYCMRKALTYAAEGPYIPNSDGTIEPQYWWTKIPCIIVKDSSISNITPAGTTDRDFPDNPPDKIIGGMKDRVKTALNKARQADLYFLCKWNDLCNKYTDVTGVGFIDHGSTLKWSVQPTATQAIMYTPSSRDYVREALVTANVTLSELLNANIAQGKLLATVFVPNIIDFDIDLATSNSDYLKLNECDPAVATVTQTTSSNSIIWFVVIVLLIIIVGWSLIVLGPQYSATPK